MIGQDQVALLKLSSFLIQFRINMQIEQRRAVHLLCYPPQTRRYVPFDVLAMKLFEVVGQREDKKGNQTWPTPIIVARRAARFFRPLV
jgi:hypothetical protein